MVSNPCAGKGRLQASLPVLLLLLGLAMVAIQVLATPTGPTITHIMNETAANIGNGTVAHRAGPGGYIVTMNLDAIQQNTHWKGFVGNISGAFALADSAGYSLYEWTVATFTGEVYASRIPGVTWTAGNVRCANDSNVRNDTDPFYNMTSANAQYDSINITFAEPNWHPGFTIGSTSTSADTCNWTTKTWNATGQDKANKDADGSQFEEVMLWDEANDVPVFMTLIETDVVGFDTNTYDYQMILPENSTTGAAASNTAYYFFVELL